MEPSRLYCRWSPSCCFAQQTKSARASAQQPSSLRLPAPRRAHRRLSRRDRVKAERFAEGLGRSPTIAFPGAAGERSASMSEVA